MGQIRKRGKVWWIRYYRNGRRYEETSGSTKQSDAARLLRIREGDVARGVPITPLVGRVRFEETATDIVNDYRINGKRSIDVLKRRLRLHLAPVFGGRRMAAITTVDVRAYVAGRQAETVLVRQARRTRVPDGRLHEIPEERRPVSNGAINRELTTLKRMFSLAVQGGKLLHKPHIPLLRESNTRTGFFERDQFASVLGQLPAPLVPMLEFAYVTGWRIDSEVLRLEWPQVDFAGSEVRLDPHTTKNDGGRVFPMTDDLRRVLEGQKREVDRLAREHGQIIPWVFFRLGAKGRGGPKHAKPITSFTKAWKTAVTAAGCPGRIPHDLRRTAVRNMVRRGVPERVAMQLTGHKTRSVFERYNIVSNGDLRTAARHLDGLVGTKKGQPAVFHPEGESEVVGFP